VVYLLFTVEQHEQELEVVRVDSVVQRRKLLLAAEALKVKQLLFPLPGSLVVLEQKLNCLVLPEVKSNLKGRQLSLVFYV